MKIISGIYKITSPSGKVYIGQSIDILRRFSTYRRIGSNTRSQRKLYNSLKKYGHSNHLFEIIHECAISELNLFERKYQDEFLCIGANGLNCGLTKTNDLSGKKSDETKSKIKLAKTGTYHSDFTRDKISNTKKSQNLKLSDKEKYIKSINSKLSRKVLKIETNEIFHSAAEAARRNNIRSDSMNRMLNRSYKRDAPKYKYLND